MNFLRQMDIVAADDLKVPIHLIGAGGIGSPTVIALAKMGCTNISVYDDDVVDDHNLPNQFYRTKDIGQLKVDALRSIVIEHSECVINAVSRRVVEENFSGIVICTVDSMQARHDIWNQSIRLRGGVDLYIDARMGAEVYRVYSINSIDIDHVRTYEATLYSDEEAEELSCTARAIIYNTLSVAAIIANQVKKFVCGESLLKEIVFDLKTLSLICN